MVSGGMTCVKYLLFCFNLLFAVNETLHFTNTNEIRLFSDIWHCFKHCWHYHTHSLLSLLRVCLSKCSISPSGDYYYRSHNICGSFLRMLWRSERKPLHDHDSEFCSFEWFTKLQLIFNLFQFALLILIIITMELAAAVTGYMRRAEMSVMLQDRVNVTMQEYPTHPGTRKSWDIMQHEVSHK